MAVASICGGSGQEVPGSGEEEPSGDGSDGVASVGIRPTLPGGRSDNAAAWCGRQRGSVVLLVAAQV
jgi:hypothetical protein